jgi:hypothetical protein
VKTQVIAALKADYPLPVLLAVADLARSTFFCHQARLTRPDPHAELKTAITEALEAARGPYGHRRIHTVLTRADWQVAKKTVLALMNTLGLVCKATAAAEVPVLARADRHDRRERAQAPIQRRGPDTKWVTDVTNSASVTASSTCPRSSTCSTAPSSPAPAARLRRWSWRTPRCARRSPPCPQEPRHWCTPARASSTSAPAGGPCWPTRA